MRTRLIIAATIVAAALYFIHTSPPLSEVHIPQFDPMRGLAVEY